MRDAINQCQLLCVHSDALPKLAKPGFSFRIEKIQMYSVLNTTYAIPVVGALGLSFAKFFSKFGGVFKK